MKRLVLFILLLLLPVAARATPVQVSGLSVSNWTYGPPAYLRIYSSGFTASDSTVVPAGNVSGGLYQQVACSVVGATVTCPAFTIQTTTDALDNQQATYTAILFDSANRQRIVVFSGFSVPTSLTSSFTYQQLVAFNAAVVPVRDDTTYTKNQINQLYQGSIFANPATITTRGVAKSSMSVADPVFVETTDARVLDASAYSSLATAISTIGSTETTLNVSTSISVAASITIPANVTLRKIGAGQITIASGQQLLVLGSVVAPRRQFFAGSGTVSFAGNVQVSVVAPEWWGAKADGVTDSTAALQASINAAETETNPAALSLASGGYLISGSGTELLLINRPLDFSGQGMRASYIVVANSVGNVPVLRVKPPSSSSGAVDTYNRGYHLHDFGIMSQGGSNLNTSYSGGNGLMFDTTGSTDFNDMSSVERVYIGPLGGVGAGVYGVAFTDADVVYSTFNITFRNCMIYNGVFAVNIGDTASFYDCEMLGENEGIYVLTNTGASAPLMVNCNITNKKGVRVANGMNFTMIHCFIELFRAGSVGTDGALVSLNAISPGSVIGAQFIGCLFGTPSGPNLNAIYLNGARYTNISPSTHTNLNAGKSLLDIGASSTFATNFSTYTYFLGGNASDAGRFVNNPTNDVHLTIDGIPYSTYLTTVSPGYPWWQGARFDELKVGAPTSKMTAMYTVVISPGSLGSIAAGGRASFNVTFSEGTIAPGDEVAVDFDGDLGAGFGKPFGRVINSTTVTVYVNNVTAGALTPATVNYRVTVRKMSP
jgi:hypothetical protein